MDDFPKELSHKILRWLTWNELAVISTCSTTVHVISSDESLWFHQCQRLWKGKENYDGCNEPLKDAQSKITLTWRQSFMNSIVDSRRTKISVRELVSSPWVVHFGRYHPDTPLPTIKETFHDNDLFASHATFANFDLDESRGRTSYFDMYFHTPGTWSVEDDDTMSSTSQGEGPAPPPTRSANKKRKWRTEAALSKDLTTSRVRLQNHEPLRVFRRSDWGWRLLSRSVLKDSMPLKFLDSQLWSQWEERRDSLLLD